MNEETGAVSLLLEILEALGVETVLEERELATIDHLDVLTDRAWVVMRRHQRAVRELLEARQAAVEAVEAFLQEARR